MKKITILLVDDMEEYKKHFLSVLKHENDFQIVGTASSGKEAVSLAKELKPDIILMDIQMEHDKAGIYATKEILKALSDTKIIILTIHGDEENIIEGYEAGICDFLLKTSESYEIISAIRDAMDLKNTHKRINNIVAAEMVRLKKERSSFLYCIQLISRLSKSELEILKLLCTGKKYREIADERFVSEGTIRVMVNKISKKFSGDNIRDIIKEIQKNGIDKLLETL